MNQNENFPSNDWTLDQLGTFCRQTHKKMATDAWTIGKAMCLAKTKCQDDQKSFTAWKQKHEFSNSTASRYMRLFLAFPAEDDRERLAKIGIMEALVEAGVTKSRPGKEESIAESEGKVQDFVDQFELEHDAEAEPNRLSANERVPSWAIDDDKDELSEGFSDEANGMSDVWTHNQTLEEECRKAVPWQLRLLRENSERLLQIAVDDLRQAWPLANAEKQQIVDDINNLLNLLPRLAATLPIKEFVELQMAF